MRYLLPIFFAFVAAYTQGFTTAKTVVASAERSLRRNDNVETGEAESEERVNLSNLISFTSLSKKETDVVKNLKENPALAKTLSSNPSLLKPAGNFQSLQKDTVLMKTMKSLKNSPSINKLENAISRNPGALTEENVQKRSGCVEILR